MHDLRDMIDYSKKNMKKIYQYLANAEGVLHP